MRIYRDVATLAGAQVVCFLLLSHLEPQFFLLHFYQTIIYVAVLITLFYMEDRWAYMIGIVAPAVWLAMAFETGLLGASVRQILRLERGEEITNRVSFMAAVAAALSLLMIVFCTRRWIREYAGLGKLLTTFAVSLGIVVLYYGILVVWFWQMFPVASASK